MATSTQGKERAQAFTKDLRALMKKHKVKRDGDSFYRDDVWNGCDTKILDAGFSVSTINLETFKDTSKLEITLSEYLD